jgi:hypothetical protein
MKKLTANRGQRRSGEGERDVIETLKVTLANGCGLVPVNAGRSCRFGPKPNWR